MRTNLIFKGFFMAFLLLMLLPVDSVAQTKAKKGPPPWAPAHGYRAKTRHVYFPDHNFYYDLEKSVYIYLSSGKWQIAAKLPSSLAGIDLKKTTQIELDLDSDTPQRYNADHKTKYKGKAKPKDHPGHPGKGNGNGNAKKKK